MFVQIRCSNPGHGGRSRAGRRFENGVDYRMEVIEQLAPGQADHHGNGPVDNKGVLSMEVIDRAGLAKVRADPTMSVLEGGDTAARLSEAAFNEVRGQLKAALNDLADARVRIADLEAGNLSLKEQASALAEENAALKAAVGSEPANDALPVGETPAETEAPAATKRAKKGS